MIKVSPLSFIHQDGVKIYETSENNTTSVGGGGGPFTFINVKIHKDKPEK
jgi:hypothetical protein